jgi:succinoglycan biosynthesis protein ExoO
MTGSGDSVAGLPSVTVLIAAYNAESFLERAVASALRQTVPIHELLIVDDASTDGTVKAARALAAGDGRVRLLTLPNNGGPSAARNAGLDAATGDWVAVLDADDAYEPERLDQMLTYAAEVRADIVVDNFRYYNAVRDAAGRVVLDDSQPNSLVSFEEFLSHARPFMPDTDWGLLKPVFRRAFLNEHQLRYPLKTRHGEDFLFLCEAFLNGARYALCRKAGYLYTSWAGGSGDLSRTIRDYQLMYRHTKDLLRDKRIAADPRWARQLRLRAAAVRRLAAETDLARLRHDHNYNAIARRMLADNAFRMILAKRLVRRLLNPSRLNNH